MTNQLHQLSRSSTTKPNAGSLTGVLNKERSRITSLNGKYQVDLQLIEPIPLLAIESQVLHSAMAVIFDNSVEAMGNGGLIRVETELAELAPGEASRFLGAVQPGLVVLVRIQDSGVGIKPEIQKRLFNEPFFTTKVRHRGLGLAIVYRILCAHRAGIRIDSELGKGTKVTLALPPASRPGTY